MKYIVTITLLCLCSIILLFGCGNEKDGGKESGERIEITFATSSWANEVQLAEALKKKFEAQHPHIRLRIIPISSPQFQKILTMIAGGTPPDIFWLPHGDMAMEFMKRKAVLELEPLMEADEEFQRIRSDIDDEAYRNTIFDGKIYGQPIWLGIMVMFYNKDLFDEKQIPYPDSSWTWDKFLQISQKLTAKNDQRYGAYMVRDLIWSMIWSEGGAMYDADKLECYYNTPPVINAYQRAYDYIEKYKIAPQSEPLIRPGDSGAAVWEGFIRGQLAMIYHGAYMIRKFRDIEDFEWGLTLPPRGRAGSATYYMGISFGIARDSKHPKEAWEFIKFCLNEESQKLIYTMKEDIPVRKSLQESEDYLNSGSGPEINRTIIEAVQHGRREAKFDSVVFGRQWNDYVDQQVALIFLGRETPKTICNRIYNEFNKRKKAIRN